jgi:hypothetical protein
MDQHFEIKGEKGSEVRLNLRVLEPTILTGVHVEGGLLKTIVLDRKLRIHSEDGWWACEPLLQGRLVQIHVEPSGTYDTTVIVSTTHGALERE